MHTHTVCTRVQLCLGLDFVCLLLSLPTSCSETRSFTESGVCWFGYTSQAPLPASTCLSSQTGVTDVHLVSWFHMVPILSQQEFYPPSLAPVPQALFVRIPWRRQQCSWKQWWVTLTKHQLCSGHWLCMQMLSVPKLLETTLFDSSSSFTLMDQEVRAWQSWQSESILLGNSLTLGYTRKR